MFRNLGHRWLLEFYNRRPYTHVFRGEPRIARGGCYLAARMRGIRAPNSVCSAIFIKSYNLRALGVLVNDGISTSRRITSRAAESISCDNAADTGFNSDDNRRKVPALKSPGQTIGAIPLFSKFRRARSLRFPEISIAAMLELCTFKHPARPNVHGPPRFDIVVIR